MQEILGSMNVPGLGRILTTPPPLAGLVVGKLLEEGHENASRRGYFNIGSGQDQFVLVTDVDLGVFAGNQEVGLHKLKGTFSTRGFAYSDYTAVGMSHVISIHFSHESTLETYRDPRLPQTVFLSQDSKTSASIFQFTPNEAFLTAIQFFIAADPWVINDAVLIRSGTEVFVVASLGPVGHLEVVCQVNLNDGRITMPLIAGSANLGNVVHAVVIGSSFHLSVNWKGQFRLSPNCIHLSRELAQQVAYKFLDVPNIQRELRKSTD